MRLYTDRGKIANAQHMFHSPTIVRQLDTLKVRKTDCCDPEIVQRCIIAQ